MFVIKFLKTVFEAYIDNAGRYPLPILWAY